MSQITRCPSCATMFRVVADQLRISDGWVRCGQCKEVFDASVHLLPVEAQALLPDVSMAAARPPPTPAERATAAGLTWGAPPSSVEPAASSALAVPPTGAHDSYRDALAPDAVLDVPDPAVPAFLVAKTAAVSFTHPEPEPHREPHPEPEPTPQPVSPLDWQSPGLSADGNQTAPTADALAGDMHMGAGESPREAISAAPLFESPAGYELPSAEWTDAEWSEELPFGDSTTEAGAPHPPVELLREQSVEEPAASDFGNGLENGQAPEAGSEQAPDTPFDEPSSSEGPPSQSASDMGPGEVLVKASLGGMPKAAEDDDLPEEASYTDTDTDTEEVSFVRAAKRKAFWRRPFVRVALGAVSIVLLCALALQAVLQERDRIAAIDPRVRPWLLMLCDPFQCDLAPLRQIADVVIDSSSFNKGRGDSYQLTFAIKNRATVPLATPAMELTLTDAQDQPVLRRVFLPPEMAAPAELPALGEWTASVAVIVTTGGARVAGYRLVAFYP